MPLSCPLGGAWGWRWASGSRLHRSSWRCTCARRCWSGPQKHLISASTWHTWLIGFWHCTGTVHQSQSKGTRTNWHQPLHRKTRRVGWCLCCLLHLDHFFTLTYIYIYTHDLLTIAHIAIFIDAYVMGTIVISPHPTGIDSGGKTQ